MTITHQNLGELDNRTVETVLANSIKYVFRVSIDDDEALNEYLGQKHSVDQLPVFPPMRFRKFDGLGKLGFQDDWVPELDTEPNDRNLTRVIKQSRHEYAIPASAATDGIAKFIESA